MTDFVQHILDPNEHDYVVRSNMDTDFYKHLMGQYILTHFPDVEVTFSLVNRHKDIPVAEVVDKRELRVHLDHVMGITSRRTDLYYMRGMDLYGRYMFNETFLDFWKEFRFTPYELRRDGNQYRLDFPGLWKYTTYWEIPAMKIVFGLYFRSLLRRMTRGELTYFFEQLDLRLRADLALIAQHPRIRFADFSTRRTLMFLWHLHCLKTARAMVGNQLMGTSNVYMAFNQDMVPIGTNAHELPMVQVALCNTPEAMRAEQYRVLRLWTDMYSAGLGVFLPDTYGTTQFLRGAPQWVATEMRGARQDSGVARERCEEIIAWYAARGVDARTKLLIPSDGHSVQSMIELDKELGDRIPHPYGWGTKLTCNISPDLHPKPDSMVPGLEPYTWRQLLKPFSLVCKAMTANRVGEAPRPTVKLSDNPEKALGPKEEVARYREVFHTEAQKPVEVFV